MKNCGWFSTLLYFTFSRCYETRRQKEVRGWRCFTKLVECRMLFTFLSIMMIEYKYLNWLRWTVDVASSSRTVFVYYWNCFQHFEGIKTVPIKALLSRLDSFKSSIPQKLSPESPFRFQSMASETIFLWHDIRAHDPACTGARWQSGGADRDAGINGLRERTSEMTMLKNDSFFFFPRTSLNES